MDSKRTWYHLQHQNQYWQHHPIEYLRIWRTQMSSADLLLLQPGVCLPAIIKLNYIYTSTLMKQFSIALLVCWPIISVPLDLRAVLLQWVVIVTSNNICRYLISLTIPCHSVPCGNKQCGWSEVGRGEKQLLQLIIGYLEKAGIRCHPEENISTSSNIHIIPEWSNQWNQVIQWKSLRSEFSKWELKWNNSICVHLWTKVIERIKPVTVIKNQLLHCCS